MKLTTFTDYSLRVLIYVAAAPAGRATIGEIARAFDISENHLMKVVHLLGRSGLLTNVRGKGGGLELARAPELINIGKVVRMTEGRPIPAECFDREVKSRRSLGLGQAEPGPYRNHIHFFGHVSNKAVSFAPRVSQGLTRASEDALPRLRHLSPFPSGTPQLSLQALLATRCAPLWSNSLVHLS